MIEHATYESCLSALLLDVSAREKELSEIKPFSSESAVETVHELEKRGFVYCPGRQVTMGVDQGLRCNIEGHRMNETPRRVFEVPSFYVAKTTVSNVEFEAFDTRHTRTTTSAGDRHPITCITYGKAISYIRWLNNQTGLQFNLPTEPQMVLASGPDNWEYSYQQEGKPDRKRANIFKSFPEVYPSGEQGSTLEVNDQSVETNYLGLYHIGGNVSVFTFGHYKAPGHWGSASDGAYTVVLGGNFRACPYGARIVSRGIIDVAGITDAVGIRLVHPDPAQYTINNT